MTDFDLTEETLNTLRKQGWQFTNVGGIPYLTAPNGMRLACKKDVAHDAPKVMRKPRKATRLYVVHARRSTRIKIGTAYSPEGRLSDMQVGSPLQLDLICSMPIESIKIEGQCHKLLSRYSGHGEWFDLGRRTPTFLAAAKECKAIDEFLKLLRGIA
jgi:hypothetical protein